MDPLFGVKTDSGTPLDGGKVGCYTPRNGGLAPDSADDLECGSYEVRVSGYSKGALAFCGPFTVFIGPGSNSMPWRLIVPPIADGACR